MKFYIKVWQPPQYYSHCFIHYYIRHEKLLLYINSERLPTAQAGIFPPHLLPPDRRAEDLPLREAHPDLCLPDQPDPAQLPGDPAVSPPLLQPVRPLRGWLR